MEELPFLPGIVIRGHEWHLFATSCDRCWKDVWYERQMGNTAALAPKKTFWHERVIGNTAALAPKKTFWHERVIGNTATPARGYCPTGACPAAHRSRRTWRKKELLHVLVEMD
jgi:hypothetical protein